MRYFIIKEKATGAFLPFKGNKWAKTVRVKATTHLELECPPSSRMPWLFPTEKEAERILRWWKKGPLVGSKLKEHNFNDPKRSQSWTRKHMDMEIVPVTLEI